MDRWAPPAPPNRARNRRAVDRPARPRASMCSAERLENLAIPLQRLEASHLGVLPGKPAGTLARDSTGTSKARMARRYPELPLPPEGPSLPVPQPIRTGVLATKSGLGIVASGRTLIEAPNRARLWPQGQSVWPSSPRCYPAWGDKRGQESGTRATGNEAAVIGHPKWAIARRFTFLPRL